MQAPLLQRLGAEFFGTFWLVFAGIGSAIVAAGFVDQLPPANPPAAAVAPKDAAKDGAAKDAAKDAPKAAAPAANAPAGYFQLGIGFLGVGLAVGLTVMTMAYAIGHISGCHLNPAVTLGLMFGKRFAPADVVPYIVAQVVGGIAGAGVLYYFKVSHPSFEQATFEMSGFGCNGFGDHSPGRYPMTACALAEAVLTGFFMFVILGCTDRRSPSGFAGVPIGLCLTLVHLIGIPITNLSVNPARSTATAVYLQGWALQQLWLFWAAPIGGAIVGALCYQCLANYGNDDKAAA